MWNAGANGIIIYNNDFALPSFLYFQLEKMSINYMNSEKLDVRMISQAEGEKLIQKLKVGEKVRASLSF